MHRKSKYFRNARHQRHSKVRGSVSHCKGTDGQPVETPKTVVLRAVVVQGVQRTAEHALRSGSTGWVNGPVYPDIYYQYRDKVSNMCDHLTAKDFDTDDMNATLAELAANLQLTAEETELLDSIVMLYGSKSQNGLIFLTHAEQPWVEAREGLAPYQRSEKEISLDTMHAYYKARHDRNRQKQ